MGAASWAVSRVASANKGAAVALYAAQLAFNVRLIRFLFLFACSFVCSPFATSAYIICAPALETPCRS